MNWSWNIKHTTEIREQEGLQSSQIKEYDWYSDLASSCLKVTALLLVQIKITCLISDEVLSWAHQEHRLCQLRENIYGVVDRKSTQQEEGIKKPEDISLCSCQEEAAHQKNAPRSFYSAFFSRDMDTMIPIQ